MMHRVAALSSSEWALLAVSSSCRKLALATKEKSHCAWGDREVSGWIRAQGGGSPVEGVAASKLRSL
jgi:hypothetical protein